MSNNFYFSLVSLPRSGSTILSNILNNFQNVKCFNQSFFNICLLILDIFYKKNLIIKKKLLDSYLFKNKKLLFKFEKHINKNNYFVFKQKQIQNLYGENFKIYKTQEKNFDYAKFYKDNLNYNTKKPILGSKEVNSDYFIKYYLSNNIKVILLVRNPFDYIYSCMYGKKDHINQDKYSINHFLSRWQYLYKYYNKSTKDLLIIRFEDLIIKKKYELLKLSKFLNTSIKKRIFFDINNSSHHDNLKFLDKKVIYASLNGLEKKILLKIFNTTKNELLSLGYLSSLKNIKNIEDIKNQLIKKIQLT